MEITVAPAALASCRAKMETPPVPWVRTTSPGLIRASTIRARQAVRAAQGRVAASAKDQPAGMRVKARAGMDSVNKHLGKLKKVYADLLQEQPVFRHATEAVFKTKAQINRAAILSMLPRPAIEHANRGKDLRAQLKKIYDASVTYGFDKHMPNASFKKVQVVLEGAEEQVEEQQRSLKKIGEKRGAGRYFASSRR